MAVQTKDGVWIGAAGKANLDANAPMTPDMQVRIAGVTKVFTAALIMRLVEENKIALTDTVEKWLPALPPGAVPSSDQITVAMLLNHTSGLSDYEVDPYFIFLMLSDPYWDWAPDPTYDEVIEGWMMDSDFPPGTAFKYCNAGYYLLGKIAEAATGEPLEDAIRTRLFSPQSMSRTALTRSGQKTGSYPRDYCWVDAYNYPDLTGTSKLMDTSGWDLSWDWTSGSGVSTAQDMLTWTRAFIGGKVVNAKSLTQMTTPQDPAKTYGYGLELFDSDPWFGEKMYGHGGENPGVLARWLYYPDSGRTIFIALNRFDSLTPPQMDTALVADAILSGVSSILLNTTP
jgi:D-alanyl-D-alanine carboxypeptidase